ncbi:MBL fold metallo-hydrolase [Fusobacterium sp.]|uniref:MBL fold metallo-hydrolase n=1 Tax=Fusobacterium sp. TaxID=68766 RepID=UPI00262843C8|nr:MBL fold metallo-hydrolase [Fusobacterium sp.]
MKVSILGSGSGGNSTFIEVDGIKFLVDAGFSGKKIECRLKEINESFDDISGILITHEHSDHIQGAGIISRKYDIPIYITKESYSVCETKLGKLEEKNLIFIDNETFILKEKVKVLPVDVMHDAKRTVGFRIEGVLSGKTLGISTDIGYVDNRVRELFKNVNIMIIESNYDYRMLMECNYPWELKDRVKSRNGHLSNNDAAKFVCESYNRDLKKVYLAHVSNDSNNFEIVSRTINEELGRFNINIPIEIARQDQVTEIYEI